MPFQYTCVDDAMQRPGWRMVVVGRIPSPWSEAAKGILHVKGVEWAAVRLDYESEALPRWSGQRNAPVVVYESERPKSGWAEILLLAERIAPSPALLPADAAERALAMGLAHEICGEEGLGWWRRIQLIQAGLDGQGGFAPHAAKYLARKYGYSPQAGAAAGGHVLRLLGMLAARLKAQQALGSGYYLGSSLTAVDIYGAAFMAMLRPLPDAVCAMEASARAAFETQDDATAAALDPVLLAHRDRIYERHLELPLAL